MAFRNLLLESGTRVGVALHLVLLKEQFDTGRVLIHCGQILFHFGPRRSEHLRVAELFPKQLLADRSDWSVACLHACKPAQTNHRALRRSGATCSLDEDLEVLPDGGIPFRCHASTKFGEHLAYILASTGGKFGGWTRDLIVQPGAGSAQTNKAAYF